MQQFRWNVLLRENNVCPAGTDRICFNSGKERGKHEA